MQASFLITCYLGPFRSVLNGPRLEKLSPAAIVRKTNFSPIKNGNFSGSARCCGMMRDGGISCGPLCFNLLKNRRAKIRPQNWYKIRSKHLLIRTYHRTGKPYRKNGKFVTQYPLNLGSKVSVHLRALKKAYRAAESLTEAFRSRTSNICLIMFWKCISTVHSMCSNEKLDFDLWHSSSWPMV